MSKSINNLSKRIGLKNNLIQNKFDNKIFNKKFDFLEYDSYLRDLNYLSWKLFMFAYQQKDLVEVKDI